MYIPSAFRVEEQEALQELMRQHSFATLVTVQEDGIPFATHLPFLLDAEAGEYGTLRGHVARANPQWEHFVAGREVLVLFQGPHAYISPSWYETQPAVPTWNYVAVHAYGVPELLDETGLRALLYTMVTEYEGKGAESWQFAMPPAYVEQMMRGIVGFEIPIRRLEGKEKMSQNRSETDRQRVAEALQATGRDSDAEAAAAMVRTETRKELS